MKMKKQSQFVGTENRRNLLYERLLWQYSNQQSTKKQSQFAGLWPEIRSTKLEIRNNLKNKANSPGFARKS
jgi:hypothetical protein